MFYRSNRRGSDTRSALPTPSGVLPARLAIVLVASLTIGCGDNGSSVDETPVETTISESPNDYAPFDHVPSFEPDYVNLTAQPWVEPASEAQSNEADVMPDRLEFPESMSDVATWKPGRLVVAGPSMSGDGKNAMGFARRVTKDPYLMDGKWVVETTVPAVEDILQGEFQLELNAADAAEMVDGIAMAEMQVDLSKADLAWMAENLYALPDFPTGPGEPLTDDYPLPPETVDIFDDIGDGLGAAANAVGDFAVDVYQAVTPSSLSGSVNLSPTIAFSTSAELFTPFKITKQYQTSGGVGYQLFIDAKRARYAGGISMNPGVQVGARIGIPGHNVDSEYWLNIDASLDLNLSLDFQFEAGVESFGGEPASVLKSSAASTSKELAKLAILGDPDLKSASPPGGWKKVLWLSSPKMVVFAVGPVPVVLTQTMQVNLECGFQAKGTINTQVDIKEFHTYKYRISSSGTTNPTYYRNGSKDIQVEGSGELSVSCGLVPRVNVFLYDTAGLFAGIRGSLVGNLGYRSTCPTDAPNESRPTGNIFARLYANFAVLGGYRVQFPGSSFSKSAPGIEDQIDFWKHNILIAAKNWAFPTKGLGYCTPTCQNGKLDGEETDIDCGSQCKVCTEGQQCERNRDCDTLACINGTCATLVCGNGVWDGAESDIDCGGANCYLCEAGKHCTEGDDCLSSFCTEFRDDLGRLESPQVCVDNHCDDGLKDATEGGVDCGGGNCRQCVPGEEASHVSDCDPGFHNGSICVANACLDLLVSSDETDVDCGGASSCDRCTFQRSCESTTDCIGDLSCHPDRLRCVREIGDTCTSGNDCLSSVCLQGLCAAADSACLNGVLDADETDIDCGGPSCNSCGAGQQCTGDTDCIYGLCGTNSSCAPPATLLAAWPFDGNGTNVSDPSRPATLSGGATFSSVPTEVQSGGGAVSFPSAPGALASVDTIDLGQQFTISAWVRVPDVSLNRRFVILSNQLGFDFYMQGAELSLRSNAVDCTIRWTGDVVGNPSWQHLAIVVDMDSSIAFAYHNGVRLTDFSLFDENAGGGYCIDGFSTNQPLSIGGKAGETLEAGGLDDLRVYNYALSAVEIAALTAQ